MMAELLLRRVAIDQLSNPTLSTSVAAALRLATIFATGVGSATSLP